MKYIMGLSNNYFEAMKNGRKTVELRLLDEKRKQLKSGNIITFCKEPERIEQFDTIVTDLTIYENINDALKNIPISLLAPSTIDATQYLNDFLKFYNKEKLAKYKILAITVDKIKSYEKSCGVVVLKKSEDKIKVLLVHHNIGHWGIPKGHVEKGETEQETAIREVFEETGVKSTIISDFREVITYSPKKSIAKNVIFFLGTTTASKVIKQEKEVQEVAWIDLEQAKELITYDEEKLIIGNVITYLNQKNIEIN